MRAIAILLVATTVSACQASSTPPIDQPSVESGKSCGADRYQHLIGQNIRDIDVESLDVPSYRVVAPNQPVTMDFRPNRLNIGHDHKGVITSMICT